MIEDPFGGDGIPNDNPIILLHEWVDRLREAKRAKRSVSIRLTGGSLHVGQVIEVRPTTVVLDALIDGDDFVEHIALQAIAALSVRQ